jgi:hypothetical protein
LGPAADIFSFGLLLWLVICDGTNPFQELYDLEDDWITTFGWDAQHKGSHEAGWHEKSSHGRLTRYQEKEFKAFARATTNQRIQQLKENNQLVLLAKIDLEKSLPNNPEELDFFLNWLRIALNPNPEHRLGLVHVLSKSALGWTGFEIPSCVSSDLRRLMLY